MNIKCPNCSHGSGMHHKGTYSGRMYCRFESRKEEIHQPWFSKFKRIREVITKCDCDLSPEEIELNT